MNDIRTSETKLLPGEELVRRATVTMIGWYGRLEYAVDIVGETPKRYRIRAIERMRIPGRDRWLEVGQTRLVPRHAVRLQP